LNFSSFFFPLSGLFPISLIFFLRRRIIWPEKMPLVVICGIPCSGKTHHAQLLEKHFVESGKKVHLINEESLHITKADGYKGTPLGADSLAREEEIEKRWGDVAPGGA
jgi:adenylylsulfate kinase-like enzyme